MSYAVTVKNDSLLTNGQGSVHTWLELSDGSSNVVYFGFTPDSGYFNEKGMMDGDIYLEKRIFSEKKDYYNYCRTIRQYGRSYQQV